MRTASASLALLVLLAGCVAPPEGDAPPGDDARAEESVLPWALTECRYLVGWSFGDPAIVQANLPEGFTVRAAGPLGLPAPGPAGRALIGTEAFECASGAGLDGTVEPMTYASLWIPVSPPDEYDLPDGPVYYKLHVLVPDAPRRELMLERGLSVGAGEIAWRTPTIPGAVAASVSIEGFGEATLELLAPRDATANEGGEFSEITPAGERGADGFAIWRASYAWDVDTYQAGDGFITWPAGHWVTEAIGMERAPAQFHAGTWSFNGTVTLPPR